jgi:hypothetical protein
VSREADIAALLLADAPLLAVLTGGIYVYGELSPEGITRDQTPAAFDAATGFLLPCALVKQRGEIPTFELGTGSVRSANQVVEIYLYEAITYNAIDAAKPLIYGILTDEELTAHNGYEIYLANTISRQRDMGALQDASMERVDYVVPFVMMPT